MRPKTFKDKGGGEKSLRGKKNECRITSGKQVGLSNFLVGKGSVNDKKPRKGVNKKKGIR